MAGFELSTEDEGEQHIGGIIIPDTAKEKPQQGTVIVVGNGKVKGDRKRIPLDVKAGDRILFGKDAGQEVKLDGEEYLIMSGMRCWRSSKATPRRSWPISKARPKGSKSDRVGPESFPLTT